MYNFAEDEKATLPEPPHKNSWCSYSVSGMNSSRLLGKNAAANDDDNGNAVVVRWYDPLQLRKTDRTGGRERGEGNFETIISKQKFSYFMKFLLPV